MALLLAMYQKMRLIREINESTLKLTKISSKISRVTKNIERTQKRYTSLFAQLKQQATQMQSNAKLYFQEMAGIGNGCVNPYNYSGMNGLTSGLMQQMLTSEGFYKYKDSEGEDQVMDALTPTQFNEMMSEYMSNGGTFVRKKGDDGKWSDEYANWDKAQVTAFNIALRQAQSIQSKRQSWAQQCETQYGNNISIWLQNAEAQLEAEQDAALEPLQYEDTMLQLEKEQLDARLQRLRAEKESYDQLAGEEAKNMAPTFGLR